VYRVEELRELPVPEAMSTQGPSGHAIFSIALDPPFQIAAGVCVFV
jgi:hypothetical protein